MNSATHQLVVFGASGDLAKKKIYPALFSLYHDAMLPPDLKITGYARTPMSNNAFQHHIAGKLKCRMKEPYAQTCDVTSRYFLDDLDYVSGEYTSFNDLQNLLHAIEKSKNRLFYLSLPPSTYKDITQILPILFSKDGWNRVIIEKPFGKDLQTFYDLSQHIRQYIPESSIYRMDHYLGKEVVENITVLRTHNPILEALWSHKYIQSVSIRCWEDFGIENRGYFDDYGIIRDIVQNHLLQILALITMDLPAHPGMFTQEKVKALRSVETIPASSIARGQYDSYHNNTCVKSDSKTETYARMSLTIRNDRWQGVPFVLEAGKGMPERLVEVRIVFKQPLPSIAHNELVLQIQPQESIKLLINNKTPGMQRIIETSTKPLDLTYQQVYEDKHIPDAYEKLLLDAFHGEQKSFISYEELEQSWRILSHVLSQTSPPHVYPFGSLPNI